MKQGNFKLLVGVLAAITAVGVACWIYQLVAGLGVSGMSNTASWGLYIAMFMLFEGLSGGAMIVAASGWAFGIERLKPIALPAFVLALACICCAGMLILIDLGGIGNIWRMVVGLNLASPLAWDMCAITVYLVLCVLAIVWLVRGDTRRVRGVSFALLPMAALVLSIGAWLFGLQAGRAWHTAIMAPIFIASALDSGTALLLLALAGLDKAGVHRTDDGTFRFLAGLLAVFVAVDAFLIGCELLTMGYPGGEEAVALGVMTGGATAPYFWFEMIAGLLVPFLALATAAGRQRRGVVLGASVLVVLGVACKRMWLLLTSFVVPNVYGAPGVAGGAAAARAGDPAAIWGLLGSYAPTAVEGLVVLGVAALGALGFILAAQRLAPAA